MRALTIAPVLLVAACGMRPVRFQPMSSPPRPMTARPVDSVEIFREQLPPRPFIEVGVVEVYPGNIKYVRPEKALPMIREEAAARGCDGLLLDLFSDYRGTCIAYR